jgi:hypothetical protein
MSVSAGVTGTMPYIFFDGHASQIRAFKGAERAADETIDGEDCYVLKGEVMGIKLSFWVGKDTFLIKQKRVILGGKATVPEISDADIDEQLKKMGNLTPAQKAQAKVAMKNMKPVMEQLKGTMTETYRNIKTDQPLKKADFNYELAPGAKLSKTL